MRSVAIKAIAYNEIGVSFTSVRTPADGSKLHASLLFFFKNWKKRENLTEFVPLKKKAWAKEGVELRANSFLDFQVLF